MPTAVRRSLRLRDGLRTWPLPPEVTPELAFRVAASRLFPFFLDSASAGAGGGGKMFSFVGHSPTMRFQARGRRLAIANESARVRRHGGDPWTALRAILESAAVSSRGADELSFPFRGGFVGYFGYDLGRTIEQLPSHSVSDLPFPDLHLAHYSTFVAFDHRAGAAALVGSSGPLVDDWRRSIDGWLGRLGACETTPRVETVDLDDARMPRPDVSKGRYLTAVRRVKRYIAAGDVYQVNLAHRFSGRTAMAAAMLYERLRQTNSAPFGAFLGMGRSSVLSSSPERYLALRGRSVVTQPIKGTRPRGATPQADAALRRELVESPKDHAELAMIVDLERNDLGRVCEFGSIEATWPPIVESYATVHHLEATVRGMMRRGADRVDLLRAAFPGGSITGAPKIRAMEIIDELEPTRRAVYTGAIGYLGNDGSLDLNVAIRTILHRAHGEARGGAVWFHAGGGIVADSDPEAEYAETMAKAEGLRRAFETPRG
ncbi:MAG: anthranilate synthase component I family protein [Planctomycetes bacterium]|nr:anthranilate synthase component I family protein [Planctomycetota bacterium]